MTPGSKYKIEKTIQFLTRGKSIFGIDDNKIKVGSLANITMFNPDKNGVFKNEDILSKSRNCSYINHQSKGYVVGSLNNGILSMRNK